MKMQTIEKRLFKELQDLRAKVGYMDEHLTAAQKNVARINARLEALEQANREVEFLAMYEKMHAVHRAMCNIPFGSPLGLLDYKYEGMTVKQIFDALKDEGNGR
jgi:hypothetical protein